LRWEDKEPGHLGCATARSSDEDAPAHAPAASSLPPPAKEINFMKWDVTEMNSIPWDQLSFSLTGSKTMKQADVLRYLFPGLCLASEMMMLHAKEPKGMIKMHDLLRVVNTSRVMLLPEASSTLASTLTPQLHPF
jgi:hypothetical protein